MTASQNPQKTDFQKKQFRRDLLQKRASAADQIAPVQAGEMAAGVCHPLYGGVQAGQGLEIAGFWPIRDEIDPRPLMQKLALRGHCMALPRIIAADHPLDFHRWAAGAELVSGPFGTSEPSQTELQIIPDVILMPLLGFDQRGMRLGYGGGYYDRSLAQLQAHPKFTDQANTGKTGTRKTGTGKMGNKIGPICIGLAYDQQYVPNLPCLETDYPLDLVITPSQIHSFSEQAHQSLQKAL